MWLGPVAHSISAIGRTTPAHGLRTPATALPSAGTTIGDREPLFAFGPHPKAVAVLLNASLLDVTPHSRCLVYGVRIVFLGRDRTDGGLQGVIRIANTRSGTHPVRVIRVTPHTVRPRSSGVSNDPVGPIYVASGYASEVSTTVVRQP